MIPFLKNQNFKLPKRLGKKAKELINQTIKAQKKLIEQKENENFGCLSYMHIHYSKFCNYKYCPMCGAYIK